MYDFFFGNYSPWMMVFFFVVIGGSLLIDLKAHGDDKPITIKNALMWSGIWIALALGFAALS